MSHMHPGVPHVLIGLVAAYSVISWGMLVEKSDMHVFADINKSTMDMALRLFGREERPVMEKDRTKRVALVSAGVALLTAVAEETTFRGQVVSALAAVYPSESQLFLLLASSLLFGVAHISFGSHPKDMATMIGLQTINGMFFGAAFFATGGNLFASILAHAMYDFQGTSLCLPYVVAVFFFLSLHRNLSVLRQCCCFRLRPILLTPPCLLRSLRSMSIACTNQPSPLLHMEDNKRADGLLRVSHVHLRRSHSCERLS